MDSIAHVSSFQSRLRSLYDLWYKSVTSRGGGLYGIYTPRAGTYTYYSIAVSILVMMKIICTGCLNIGNSTRVGRLNIGHSTRARQYSDLLTEGEA